MTDDANVRIETERFSAIPCSQCGAQVSVEGLEPFTAVVCPGCGHAQTVPSKFGPFALLKLLGTGGMGGVYYARDESLGRFVAIKVMLASLGEDPEFVETFRREAQAAARLNNPHVAQIYSFGQEKGQPYIVMELVSGDRFDKMVEADEPLPPRLVMSVGLDIAEGLQAADEVGLVHGDIKPENILLDEKRSAKIVDFGIAQYANQAQDGIWGTPYYISPEKIRRQRVDAKSDIYSLGATLYHALAGRPPFDGETPLDVVRSRLDQDPPKLREVRPDVPEEVEHIVHRMLQREQSMRYPTYASLISDMRKALSLMGGPERQPSRKGKRVLIKSKKSRAASARPASDESSTAPPQTQARFVIHKTKQPPKLDKAETDEKPKRKQRPPKRPPTPAELARRRKARITALWILCGIVLAGAAVTVGLWMKARNDRAIAMRREWYTLRTNREAAAGAFARIEPMATHIAKASNTVHQCVAAVQKAVEYVTGEPLNLPAPEPPPATPAEPHAEGEAATAEPGPDAGGAVEQPDQPETDAVQEDEAAIPVAGGPPAGMASPEALRRMHGEDRDAEDPPPAADAEADAEEPPLEPELDLEPEPEPEPVEDPEIVKIGKTVLANDNRMNTIAGRAASAFQASREALTQGVNAAVSSVAAAHVQALNEHKLNLEKLVEAADETVKAVSTGTDKVVAIETAKREEERVREAAEAERRRLDEEAAEAERRRREHEALVGREKILIDTAYEGVKPMLRSNRFTDARREMEALADQLQAEESKAQQQVLVDRCKRLEAMKAVLVHEINAQPFRWGWGRGGNAKDVLGATDAHVKIVGAQIAWNDVQPAQMLHFLNHYLKSPNIRLRQLADLCLGAAIYCYEQGGVEAARNYAERAINMLPNAERDVERLLPLSETSGLAEDF
jgi:serine/threonine protein kinase